MATEMLHFIACVVAFLPQIASVFLMSRTAAKTLRRALRIAHEREQSFVDDVVMEAAIAEVAQL